MHYIVIGFGVYGVSAALHIIRSRTAEHPVRLTVLSPRQPQEASEPSEPSNDISKIVRIDYPSSARMKKAIEAQKCWKEEKLLEPYYRPVGQIVAYSGEDIEILNNIDGARSELEMNPRPRLGNSALEEHFGLTNTSNKLTLTHNDDDGIVEWEGCMKAVRESIRADQDTEIREVLVQELIHREKKLTAITLDGGEEIEVKDAKTLLAVGPWINEILNKSNIVLPPESRRPVATGLFTFILELQKDQVDFLRGKPGVSHTGKAEFQPPTRDDRKAKITWIEPFTNLRRDSPISSPSDLSKSSLAVQHMLKATEWAREYLPNLKGARIVTIKSYWDGVTSSQKHLISRHPEFNNLYVAGGGSYNHAKDLPTLGKEVVNVMIHGESPPLGSSWKPDPASSGADHGHLVATGNFEKLEQEAEADLKVQAWKEKKREDIGLGYLEII